MWAPTKSGNGNSDLRTAPRRSTDRGKSPTSTDSALPMASGKRIDDGLRSDAQSATHARRCRVQAYKPRISGGNISAIAFIMRVVSS